VTAPAAALTLTFRWVVCGVCGRPIRFQYRPPLEPGTTHLDCDEAARYVLMHVRYGCTG
jgi:hypothetical protein